MARSWFGAVKGRIKMATQRFTVDPPTSHASRILGFELMVVGIGMCLFGAIFIMVTARVAQPLFVYMLPGGLLFSGLVFMFRGALYILRG